MSEESSLGRVAGSDLEQQATDYQSIRYRYRTRRRSDFVGTSSQARRRWTSPAAIVVSISRML